MYIYVYLYIYIYIRPRIRRILIRFVLAGRDPVRGRNESHCGCPSFRRMLTSPPEVNGLALASSPGFLTIYDSLVFYIIAFYLIAFRTGLLVFI